MGILQRLQVPVIAAPMAGGPSTPELVNAVGRAGGLGFLASGSITAQQLAADLAQVEGDYGVNLFASQEPLADLAAVHAVIEQLRPSYREHGLGEPELPQVDYSNAWEDKLAALHRAPTPPAVVSVIFGCFTAAEITALHELGSEVWVTVTNPADARAAATLGVDALVVQGPGAGGHRGTWDIHSEPDSRPLAALIDAIVDTVPADLPLVAAGGIATAAEVQRALNFPQVAAVSCGTAFLQAEEAGTSQRNREILQAASDGASVATRAFSGRVARGVATAFTGAHPETPAIYPFLNPLLKPLRAHPDFAYCLAGVGAGNTRSGTAADIVAELKSEPELP